MPHRHYLALGLAGSSLPELPYAIAMSTPFARAPWASLRICAHYIPMRPLV